MSSKLFLMSCIEMRLKEKRKRKRKKGCFRPCTMPRYRNRWSLDRVSIDRERRLRLVPNSSPQISKSAFEDGFTYCAANTCNGLFYFYNIDNEGLVWNIGTGEAVKEVASSTLPPDTGYEYDDYDGFMFFAGLGFDSKSRDYKIIAFVSYTLTSVDRDNPCVYSGTDTSIILYSFMNNSWKLLPWYKFGECGCGQEDPGPEGFAGTVYKDGVLYFMEMGKIIAFDFATECFSLKIGPPLDLLRFCNRLVEFRGNLGVFAYRDNHFEFWAIEDGDNPQFWVKLEQFCFSVDVDSREIRASEHQNNLFARDLPRAYFTVMGFFNDLLFLLPLTKTGCIIYDSISRKVIKSPIPFVIQDGEEELRELKLISYDDHDTP